MNGSQLLLFTIDFDCFELDLNEYNSNYENKKDNGKGSEKALLKSSKYISDAVATEYKGRIESSFILKEKLRCNAIRCNLLANIARGITEITMLRP
uniref:Uncharacterized protein n=1 Tax=Pristionchus pacificus TaxID=54126 RepID=A0A2A6C3D3_PRIPA|eukprot:PDM72684.1 hypothetical protein PRIPAC_39118 [Pristionchus pacificus]